MNAAVQTKSAETLLASPPRPTAIRPRGAAGDMTKPYIMLLGVNALALWLVSFGLGLLVSSKPYRDHLRERFNWHDFWLALVTYTPTNVAILCCLAALIGGCASLLLYYGSVDQNGERNGADQHPERRSFLLENPLSSMLRGFVVFVAFVAGVYVGTDTPFADPTQEQYARMAGTLSLFAFLVGYDPTIFRELINFLPRPRRETTAPKA